MANLSNLEKKALKNVFDNLKKIRIAKNRNLDGISDCLTNQIEIINNEGEQTVVDGFIEYAALNDKHLSEIFDSLDDLSEHFLV